MERTTDKYVTYRDEINVVEWEFLTGDNENNAYLGGWLPASSEAVAKREAARGINMQSYRSRNVTTICSYYQDGSYYKTTVGSIWVNHYV